MFGYLLRRSGDYDLAADMMQESFTRYFERYGDRDPSVPLLFTIGRNCFTDHARRRRADMPYDESEHGRIEEQDQEKAFLLREESRQVLDALQKLDKNESDLLGLAVSSGLSYQEISEMTEMSIANVKVIIHRARAKLRQILKKGAP